MFKFVPHRKHILLPPMRFGIFTAVFLKI